MKYPRIVEDLLVKHTGGKGYGIFTQQCYAKGAVIFRVRGDRIHHTDKRLSHRAVQISEFHFLEPKRYSATWYLNHSCNPNCYVDGDAIIARRALKAGEEITTDYSLFTDYPSWDMDCACAEKKCRGQVVAYRLIKTAPEDKQFVSSYLKK